MGRSLWVTRWVLLSAVLSWGAGEAWAKPGRIEGTSKTRYEKRKEARKRLEETVKALKPEYADRLAPKQVDVTAETSVSTSGVSAAALAGFNPAVDYTLPNFANSPNLRKFVDALPGLGAPGCTVSVPAGTGTCNENALGQYIPIANPDTATYPGSHYYEIGLKKYQKQLHSDLPAIGTMLRGYYQKNNGTVGQTDHSQQYLGPLIIANRDVPVRIKFVNELPISGGGMGDLPYPVDMTVMGAGMGPQGGMYTDNRADLHLHGGLVPWISDGTPHQWITPAGDPTPYKKGASFANVPDMVGPGKSVPAPSPGDGIGTYYYPNQQSARLMFYHDHSYGITRLNVYAGEAAGYLLTDDVEEDFITGGNASGANPNGLTLFPNLGGAYKYGIPLVIQDKTFVNDIDTPAHPDFAANGGIPTAYTSDVDPLWNYSTGGNFWLPHEYMPNEDIYSPLGYNPMGRWDYGPWMFPPMLVMDPVLPSPTIIPEAFGDTAVVNGTAFPYLTLPPTAVRFRILNACNDRMLNLQLYYAMTKEGVLCKGPGAPAQSLCTEVSMVPAAPRLDFPMWPKDGRDGGVPDPLTAGPDLIQIGNEGGFLVKPAVYQQQPVDYDYSRRSVTFGGVTSTTLYLVPAVRADVIVDFSSAPPGSTLILYNDAPAPMPLFDSRYDYFTDGPDLRDAGGAPPTLAGFGPNTRTLMQIRIDPAGTPTAAYDVGALEIELPKVFAASQDAPLFPASAYNLAYGTSYQDIYARTVDESLNATGVGQQLAKVVVEVPGQGYTTPPTVVFSGGGGTGAAATASLNGVTGVVLVNGGTGYTSPPTVTFTGGGGTGAAAVATVSGGVVTTISISDPGMNYTTAPTVTLTGGGGTGAQAVATITLGSVGRITITNPGSGYLQAPQVFLTGGGGVGAAAASLLVGAKVLNFKNLVEGFDMEFGRMNAVLGSTPSPLAPGVGAGPVIGAAFYIDPPTEVLKGGESLLWRITHVGVDSHAIHFHLFNVQVVNRVDWTNTIKPPYPEEMGWKETIRTNPFEDIIVALRPAAMTLPFAVPDSVRLLDPTMPEGAIGHFQPVPPPIGLPAVAQITNVMTNFSWEYVWHCHLLGHEENDMMRPIVFQPEPAKIAVNPTAIAFGTVPLGTTSPVRTVTVSNGAAAGGQTMIVGNVQVTGPYAADYAITSNSCTLPVPPGTSCTVGLTFRPGASGARNGTLTIASSDPARPTVNVALTGSGPSPLLAPTSLRATISSATAITLSWRDNSTTETAYLVYRSVNGGAPVQIATVPRSGTLTTGTGSVTWTNTGLTAGATYAYYVVASNTGGTSPPSATVTITFSAPAAPTSLAATATVISSTYDQVRLTWVDRSNNESSFQVQRATNATFTAGLSTTAVGANATSLTQSNRPRGATYYYRIRATNPVGSSAWTNATPFPIVTP